MKRHYMIPACADVRPEESEADVTSLYDALEWQRIALSGTPAAPEIHLHWASVGDGAPSALLIAGTHGDEGPWSALAIRDALQHERSVLRGRIVVVFTANPLAAAADARNAPIDAPNCVDLDGCFPGNARGSHTERIAAALTPLIDASDLILDLHGGGSWCMNAFTKVFEGSEEVAMAFGAPFHRLAPDKPGGLTTYARARGTKVVNVEVGGRGQTERAWQEHIRLGIERALHGAGVVQLDTPPPSAPRGTAVGPTVAIRAEQAGIFEPSLGEEAVGTIVPGGAVLGRVLDLGTLAVRETVVAPFARTAIMLARAHTCVVAAGAILYALAEPETAA
jgi:predicted deacylase